jgi:hypothetical protein
MKIKNGFGMFEKLDFYVNVLSFNRPNLLERFLCSLRSQSVTVSDERLIFWQDGYENSKDQSLGKRNNTSDCRKLIESYMPHAKIVEAKFNLGIGLSYRRAEEANFREFGMDWALFVEEDIEWGTHYLETLLGLREIFCEDSRVVSLSATGDVNGDFLGENNSQLEDFGAQAHAWSYLLRASHWSERKEIIDKYYDILKKSSYHQRNDLAIREMLSSYGVFPVFTSQDSVKEAIRVKQEKVALTTRRRFAVYTGEIGEHFNSEIFSMQGYDSWVRDDGKLGFSKEVKFKRDKVVDVLIEEQARKYYWNVFNYYQKPLILENAQSILLSSQKNQAIAERDQLTHERDQLTHERDQLTHERDQLTHERDQLHENLTAVINSRIWKSLDWYRKVRNLITVRFIRND